jgi:hypothetical protein
MSKWRWRFFIRKIMLQLPCVIWPDTRISAAVCITLSAYKITSFFQHSNAAAGSRARCSDNPGKQGRSPVYPAGIVYHPFQQLSCKPVPGRIAILKASEELENRKPEAAAILHTHFGDMARVLTFFAYRPLKQANQPAEFRT